MKQRLIIFSVIIFAFGIVGFQLYYMGIYTEVPRSMKLAECTNNPVKFHLHMPKGNSYYLVLGTAQPEMMNKVPIQFSGTVRIEGTATKIEFPVSSDLATSSGNWLTNAGLILTWDANYSSWKQFIQPDKDYNFEITFDKAPPTSTSIWLHWIQTIREKNSGI